MTHRPCGECREMVPADTGCKHWKPGAIRNRARPSAQERSTRGGGVYPSVDDLRRVVGGW